MQLGDEGSHASERKCEDKGDLTQLYKFIGVCVCGGGLDSRLEGNVATEEH